LLAIGLLGRYAHYQFADGPRHTVIVRAYYASRCPGRAYDMGSPKKRRSAGERLLIAALLLIIGALLLVTVGFILSVGEGQWVLWLVVGAIAGAFLVALLVGLVWPRLPRGWRLTLAIPLALATWAGGVLGFLAEPGLGGALGVVLSLTLGGSTLYTAWTCKPSSDGTATASDSKSRDKIVPGHGERRFS